MGAKSCDPGGGNRCGGTVNVSSLVSGPEISLDVKVRGVKYEGDKGFELWVGTDLDWLGMTKYAARPNPAAPKLVKYNSCEREDVGADLNEA